MLRQATHPFYFFALSTQKDFTAITNLLKGITVKKRIILGLIFFNIRFSVAIDEQRNDLLESICFQADQLKKDNPLNCQIDLNILEQQQETLSQKDKPSTRNSNLVDKKLSHDLLNEDTDSKMQENEDEQSGDTAYNHIDTVQLSNAIEIPCLMCSHIYKPNKESYGKKVFLENMYDSLRRHYSDKHKSHRPSSKQIHSHMRKCLRVLKDKNNYHNKNIPINMAMHTIPCFNKCKYQYTSVSSPIKIMNATKSIWNHYKTCHPGMGSYAQIKKLIVQFLE